jgi:hypothetical protein
MNYKLINKFLAIRWSTDVLSKRDGPPAFDSNQGQGISLYSIASRPVLGPTQPPSQKYWRLFPREESGPGVKLTSHLHLEPRSRMVKVHPIRCPHGITHRDKFTVFTDLHDEKMERWSAREGKAVVRWRCLSDCKQQGKRISLYRA